MNPQTIASLLGLLGIRSSETSIPTNVSEGKITRGAPTLSQAYKEMSVARGLPPMIVEALFSKETGHLDSPLDAINKESGAYGIGQQTKDNRIDSGIGSTLNPMKMGEAAAEQLAAMTKKYGDPIIAVAIYHMGETAYRKLPKGKDGKPDLSKAGPMNRDYVAHAKVMLAGGESSVDTTESFKTLMNTPITSLMIK